MKKVAIGIIVAVFVVIAVAAGLGIGGSNKSAVKPAAVVVSTTTTTTVETLTAYCVSQTEALYKKHNLPFTSKPAERPALCDKWLADNNITTKADMRIAILVWDKQLTDLHG